MPKITYHEFRPGKWVKLVDGKAVGRATSAEVAAWKKEQVTPARIWEDVVATASRPPAGKVEVTKRPVEAEPPAESGTASRSTEFTLWQDLVKQSKLTVQAEGPPKPRPHQEDTDWGDQTQIWEDVVERAKRPGPGAERQPAQKAPILARPAPEAKPRPGVKASPASPSAPAAKAADKDIASQKPLVAEVASPKLAERGRRKTVAAKPNRKAAAVGKAPEAKPVPKAAPPVKRTAKAEARARGEAASAQKVLPAAAQPSPKVPAATTIRRRPAKTAIPKPRSSSAAVSHRTTAKSKAPAAQEQPNPLYLWISAAQSDDLIAAVRTGLARYQERFNHVAEVVLCHSTDLPTLEEAKLPVDLREGKSLAPHNFWIGSK
jgi:hypothetical protein